MATNFGTKLAITRPV